MKKMLLTDSLADLEAKTKCMHAFLPKINSFALNPNNVSHRQPRGSRSKNNMHACGFL